MSPNQPIIIILIATLILAGAYKLGQLKIVLAFAIASILVPFIFFFLEDLYYTYLGNGSPFNFSDIVHVTALFAFFGFLTAVIIGWPILFVLKKISFPHVYSFPLIYMVLTVIGMSLLATRELPGYAYLEFALCGVGHGGIIILVENFLEYKFPAKEKSAGFW